MQQIFKQISWLIGESSTLEKMPEVGVLSIFDDKVLNFFDYLSKELMGNIDARKYPDVIAYAFWIRKGSLLIEKKNMNYKFREWVGGLHFK